MQLHPSSIIITHQSSIINHHLLSSDIIWKQPCQSTYTRSLLYNGNTSHQCIARLSHHPASSHQSIDPKHKHTRIVKKASSNKHQATSNTNISYTDYGRIQQPTQHSCYQIAVGSLWTLAH
jgi:hypothetical protein